MSAKGSDRAGGLLAIERGERPLVVLLFAQYFFTGTASALTQTAGVALFLGSFDAGKLPYTFIMMSVIISLLTMAYLRVGRSIGFANQLRLKLVGQIVITGAFDAGLMFGAGEWAKGLGVKEVVGEFTTRHPCCANRVKNIHRMSDLTRGVLIAPGETFSANRNALSTGDIAAALFMYPGPPATQ